MSKRGIAKIEDLKRKSIVDAVTGCWHWQGAMSGKSIQTPHIHTFDHALGDKRIMSGPKAVWNIAHGAAPRPGWFVFRRCVTNDCVNPVHHAQARSRAEIGQHIALHGSRKGTSLEARRANVLKALAAQGLVPTSPELVRAVRDAPATETGKSIAERLGLAKSTVSRIRRGERHVNEGVAA